MSFTRRHFLVSGAAAGLRFRRRPRAGRDRSSSPPPSTASTPTPHRRLSRDAELSRPRQRRARGGARTARQRSLAGGARGRWPISANIQKMLAGVNRAALTGHDLSSPIRPLMRWPAAPPAGASITAPSMPLAAATPISSASRTAPIRAFPNFSIRSTASRPGPTPKPIWPACPPSPPRSIRKRRASSMP